MSNRLFVNIATDAAPPGALPIEDFDVIIRSKGEAKIFYSVGGQKVTGIVEMNVSHETAEEPSSDSPGCHETAELVDVFGLSIAERHAWEEYWLDKDIEELLLEAIAKEAAADWADYGARLADDRKDRMIEENI